MVQQRQNLHADGYAAVEDSRRRHSEVIREVVADLKPPTPYEPEGDELVEVAELTI